jgi:hypothetical protein
VTAPLDRDRLEAQYDRAVTEYRFQVDLNWKRSEYFFVLNVAVLVAAVTLLASDRVPRSLNAAVFGAGALLAAMSMLANHVEHGYYRSARDVKRRIEDELGLGDLAISTTSGMGSGVKRLGRVRTFLAVMLTALVVIDAFGIGVSLWRSKEESRHGTVTVQACGRTIRLADADDVRVSCAR